MIFYHITTPEIWHKFSQEDYCEADSLHTEGFIHGSYSEQLEETLSLYYKDIPEVLILTIDPSVLNAPLKIEVSRNGDKFPHIYGRINKDAITHIEKRALKAL